MRKNGALRIVYRLKGEYIRKWLKLVATQTHTQIYIPVYIEGKDVVMSKKGGKKDGLIKFCFQRGEWENSPQWGREKKWHRKKNVL